MKDYGYGLWLLVVVDTAVILLFAASFYHPQSKRDWKAFGVFSAFIVALFTEMYGVPLTVYLLSSWLGNSFLGLDLTHNGGHLWAQLVGWKGDPHLSPFHLASYLFIIGGFWAISPPRGNRCIGRRGPERSRSTGYTPGSGTRSTSGSWRSWSASFCSGRRCRR